MNAKRRKVSWSDDHGELPDHLRVSVQLLNRYLLPPVAGGRGHGGSRGRWAETQEDDQEEKTGELLVSY